MGYAAEFFHHSSGNQRDVIKKKVALAENDATYNCLVVGSC